MPVTAHINFPQLPYELRSMIWTLAAIVQVQHIANTLPDRLSNESAERRRQAFVGHDNLRSDQTRLPLLLNILDPYGGRKIRLDEDGFEAFVNCLPMSAVCGEARSHAALFCRTLAPHMVLEYHNVNLGMLEPPEEAAQPMLLRDALCSSGAETLEHVYAQPTTLTVYGGRRRIKSPEYLAHIVNRFFGNKIERLILELRVQSGERNLPFWADATNAIDADAAEGSYQMYVGGFFISFSY
jgi:hypothetical protein